MCYTDHNRPRETFVNTFRTAKEIILADANNVASYSHRNNVANLRNAIQEEISGIRFEELVAVKQFYAVYLMGMPQTKKHARTGGGAHLLSGYIPRQHDEDDDYLYNDFLELVTDS